MADARAGRHQVEFAWADHGVHACAVPVLDLAAEQPAHRLKAGVGVWWDVHAGSLAHVVRAIVIDEAPRADE
jgi:hypothetical protein